MDDPAERWGVISKFYKETGHLNPDDPSSAMLSIVEWIARQSWSCNLYPGTSHDWLCVALRPGYDPATFASFAILADGQFVSELWAHGARHSTRKCPLSEARGTVTNAIQALTLLDKSHGG
jgi:hypothetical protein